MRNVALAELTDKAPANALLIAGNVAAMREALGQSGEIGVDSICAIHDRPRRGAIACRSTRPTAASTDPLSRGRLGRAGTTAQP